MCLKVGKIKEFEIEHRLDPTHFVEYTSVQFESEVSDAGLHSQPDRILKREMALRNFKAIQMINTIDILRISGHPEGIVIGYPIYI